MKTLGDRIKERLNAVGIKQYEAAKKVGVSAPTMSDWVHGNTSPKGQNMLRLATVLQTTAEWLVDGKSGVKEGLTDPEALARFEDLMKDGFSSELDSYMKFLESQRDTQN